MGHKKKDKTIFLFAHYNPDYADSPKHSLVRVNNLLTSE